MDNQMIGSSSQISHKLQLAVQQSHLHQNDKGNHFTNPPL
nr:MAG TPA: hypothetical protein [Caudoviricetes sp.]